MVTNKELAEILLANAEARIALTSRKNSNYAGGGPEGNAFKNFDIIEMITNGAISREAGMLVRITDKVARLGVLMTGGQDAVGEAVEDTLSDLANYADLTLIAWKEKQVKTATDAFIADIACEVQKNHALDGAEQMGFDFEEAKDENAEILAITDKNAGDAPHLASFIYRQQQSIPQAPGNANEDPKSILSRFLNLGRAGKSAA